MRGRLIPRRLVPLVAAAFAALVVGTPMAASDDSGGANNVVLATETADRSTLSRSALQLSQVGGPTVASSNIAFAKSYACTGCNSVAVALQAVVVTGDPSTVVPGNAAVATNDGCTGCTSYAFAYQYVVSVGRPFYLDPAAQGQLATLRAQIAELAASDLPPDELTSRLDAVVAQFKTTIDAALNPVSGAATARVDTTTVP
jgi:hypothetical protein